MWVALTEMDPAPAASTYLAQTRPCCLGLTSQTQKKDWWFILIGIDANFRGRFAFPAIVPQPHHYWQVHRHGILYNTASECQLKNSGASQAVGVGGELKLAPTHRGQGGTKERGSPLQPG